MSEAKIEEQVADLPVSTYANDRERLWKARLRYANIVKVVKLSQEVFPDGEHMNLLWNRMLEAERELIAVIEWIEEKRRDLRQVA
jgi:hypothetical protein